MYSPSCIPFGTCSHRRLRRERRAPGCRCSSLQSPAPGAQQQAAECTQNASSGQTCKAASAQGGFVNGTFLQWDCILNTMQPCLKKTTGENSKIKMSFPLSPASANIFLWLLAKSVRTENSRRQQDNCFETKQKKRTQNGQFSPLKECKTAAHYSSVRGWDVAVGERVRQRPGLRGARRQRQPGQALQPITRVSLGGGGHCFQSKKQKALCCPQSGAGTLH